MRDLLLEIQPQTGDQDLWARRDKAVRALLHQPALIIRNQADRSRLLAAEPETCRTVVLVDVLPADDQAAAELIEHAWQRVKKGGRLIVVVPNAKAVREPGARKRRDLQRMLEPLGRPRLGTSQPYRWLLSFVGKPKAGRPVYPPLVAQRYEIITALCRGNVLELGCGPGHLAGLIAGRGHAVLGVDINARKIETAARLYPQAMFVQADAAAVELPGRFQTVILAEVLEHVGEEVGARMLQRAVQALEGGGRLIVSVPNEGCIPHPNHVRKFNHHGLKKLLRNFGKPTVVHEQPYKWLLMYVDLES